MSKSSISICNCCAAHPSPVKALFHSFVMVALRLPRLPACLKLGKYGKTRYMQSLLDCKNLLNALPFIWCDTTL